MTKQTLLNNLVDLLQHRAAQQPDQIAYRFLEDGEQKESLLSYAELDQAARAIAALLQQQKGAGERALLLYPPGLDYIAAFFGCLYAGVIAVPAYPPRRNRSVERLQVIARDASAQFALTNHQVLKTLESQFDSAPELKALHWLATDQIDLSLAADWQAVTPKSETLAFLQYTSGSTAAPKGVMVSHGNLIANLNLIHAYFGHHAQSVGVIWLPPYHDMGLIGGVLQPVYGGFPVTLMSPVAFLQHPSRWLQAISRYHATTSGGPNFAYDLCVRKITPEQRKTLDLSSWDLAFNGAEMVRAETLDRFAATFAECGFHPEAFYPCYGLAEATLFASGGQKDTLPVRLQIDATALAQHQVVIAEESTAARELVSCGQALADQAIVIADPEQQVYCATDQIGEIWLAGSSMAQGYWQQAQQSAETFAAKLAKQFGDQPYLRTGDLGFLHQNELFVTGRIKELIIIGGRNHYPQDIEQTVESAHPNLRPGASAAFALTIAGEERLAIVQEIERRPKQADDPHNIIAAMRQALVETHELDAAVICLIQAGSIPKTSSGKIQRHLCREGLVQGSLKIVSEWHERQATTALPKPIPAESTTADNKEKTSSEIADWLATQLAERLNLAVQAIDPSKPFAYYGLDSREAVLLSGELEDWLQRRLSPTLVYDYPSIAALAGYLGGESLETKPAVSAIEARPAGTTDAIAIIGMGCRFPGADDPAKLWSLLSKGTDAIRPVPEDRWNAEQFHREGQIATTQGGFLRQIDRFDPAFFGISPREAEGMDPQQRLLLEVTWEAIENAGYAPSALAGSETGVFIGISTSDYSRFFHQPAQVDAYSGTGNAHSIAANRLSYLLDLHGPSFAIDTACSSSLVAIHQACQSLRTGETDLALVGGVNLMLTPHLSIAFSQAQMLAADGRCKTFDAKADGYVRGEGCGVVLLKRLQDAKRDHDQILAVVRGSAINQDGRSNGLTAPNGLAQQAVIRRALSQANVQAADIGYIEAHGTGTVLGDPIEVDALKAVLLEGRAADQPCAIGSIKTNIGHLEAAAGIAGFCKTVLILQQQQIPPHLHLKQLNPHITLENTPFVIPTEMQPWPEQQQRLAGVSSFGFGGTNAHVILAADKPTEPQPNDPERPLHLLALSAPSQRSLTTLVHQYAAQLEQQPTQSLADLCYTANTGRNTFAHRLALTANSIQQLTEQFAQMVMGQSIGHQGQISHVQQPRIGFIFTGQGSQYIGMGRQLYETQPTFRAALNRCAAVLDQELEHPLLSVLYPEDDSSLLNETAYTQPALFALEYALATLWRSWGIEPDILLGHSVGEYAAACIAGVFSLEDGLKLIAARARLMQALPAGGTMTVIFAKADEVKAAIAEYSDTIGIAAFNGPKNTVISGAAEQVKQVTEAFEAKGVRVQSLTVSHAFHSPLMEPMLDDFSAVAETLHYQAPKMGLISNLSGQHLADEQIPDAAYWRDHIRQPVRFAEGMQALAEQQLDLLIEIGPDPVLIGMGKRCISAKGLTWLPSLKRKATDNWTTLLEALGQLFVAGIAVDWLGFDQDYQRTRVPLPTTPYERQRYWLHTKETWSTEATSVPEQAEQTSTEQPETPPPIPAADTEISQNPVTVAEILAASKKEQRTLAETYLHYQIAALLKLSPERLNRQQPLDQGGFDSLMIVELQQRLQKNFGVDLPLEPFLLQPTIAFAAELLCQRLAKGAKKT